MSIRARDSATCATRALFPLLATLALVTNASSEEIATPDESVTAVWNFQILDFSFASFDVSYSCSSLRAKIASILRAVVAPQATKIGIRCSSLGLGTSVTAKILIASPIEATPEIVRALTTFDARSQLVARVRSLQLPAEEDLQRFAAHWRPVSLSRGKGLNLNASDCDLVRSIRDQLLPHLSVKVTRSTGMCGNRTPVLEVLALLPSDDSTNPDQEADSRSP